MDKYLPPSWRILGDLGDFCGRSCYFFGGFRSICGLLEPLGCLLDTSRAPQERPRAPPEQPRAPQERPRAPQERPKTGQERPCLGKNSGPNLFSSRIVGVHSVRKLDRLNISGLVLPLGASRYSRTAGSMKHITASLHLPFKGTL